MRNGRSLLGDQYLTRVYRIVSQRFHLEAWDASILRKLQTLESIYGKMSDRAGTRRMEVLEWIIIALITLSIAVSLFYIGPALKTFPWGAASRDPEIEWMQTNPIDPLLGTHLYDPSSFQPTDQAWSSIHQETPTAWLSLRYAHPIPSLRIPRDVWTSESYTE